MKIGSIGQLETLTQIDQNIANLLSDFNISRRKVVDELYDRNIDISEKLVRTYRDRIKAGYIALQESLEEEIQAADVEEKSTRIWFSDIKYDPAVEIKKGKPQSSGQRVIAFGDFQINKHDPDFIDRAIELVKDQQPDMICLTGDESDNSAVGRWAKGMREEYESNLQDQIDETIEYLTKIREAAPNARIMMAHSNHMEWITRAVETRLPGFASLRYLTPEVMYELADLEITYERKIVEFLPDFLLGHGHQWELTSKSHVTKGVEHVMRTGKSILAGHVHQAALRPVYIGYEGKGTQHVYVNPGCMMDFEKAMESNGGYIKGTSPNWSKGIAVITREAGQNYTELILGQNNGTFRYENKIY